MTMDKPQWAPPGSCLGYRSRCWSADVWTFVFYVIDTSSKNNDNKRMPSFVALTLLIQLLCFDSHPLSPVPSHPLPLEGHLLLWLNTVSRTTVFGS